MKFERGNLYRSDDGLVVMCTHYLSTSTYSGMFFDAVVVSAVAGSYPVGYSGCFFKTADFKPYPFKLAFVALENQE